MRACLTVKLVFAFLLINFYFSLLIITERIQNLRNNKKKQ